MTSIVISVIAILWVQNSSSVHSRAWFTIEWIAIMDRVRILAISQVTVTRRICVLVRSYVRLYLSISTEQQNTFFNMFLVCFIFSFCYLKAKLFHVFFQRKKECSLFTLIYCYILLES